MANLKTTIETDPAPTNQHIENVQEYPYERDICLTVLEKLQSKFGIQLLVDRDETGEISTLRLTFDKKACDPAHCISVVYAT